MHYYEHTSIEIDDQTIALHALIDACNGSIAYRLLEHLGFPCVGKRVLDLGAGTGQVSRFLSGFPGLIIEACDPDPKVALHFSSNPELNRIPFHSVNCFSLELGKFDAVVARGVYHHIGKSDRPSFLKRLLDLAPIAIIADEGIQEYSSEGERLRNCEKWYRYVIAEAQRRKIEGLALIETEYLRHEQLGTADDGGDYKESPSHLLNDAAKVNMKPKSVDRYGPWDEFGGGFFTATFTQ
ncbi:MAG TPA: class I SAM-dependent methyltransferase [Candidatus Angelobacter sp.]|nr:class I SAM-dependent methyltransferase [Candidatus Angelobacter sp.]